jgi:hypothetical protein
MRAPGNGGPGEALHRRGFSDLLGEAFSYQRVEDVEGGFIHGFK